jgi:hypothetical protein
MTKKENQIEHKDLLKKFLNAVRTRKLLIIIDSASRGYNAIFSLVSYDTKEKRYQDYYPLLKELGFKNHRDVRSLFKTACAGRLSLFILDNIGSELKGKGVKLPKWWYSKIQNQQTI